MVDIDVILAAPGWRAAVKRPEALARRAAEAALREAGASGTITVLLTDDAAVKRLNSQHRAKVKPTNVLSFPMLERGELLALPADGPPEMLGDIALAWETCAREAEEKAIGVDHHAMHLIIHALLHLAGHDHETSPEDARAMEELEIKTLAHLGIADPYGDHHY